ncbi:MAG: hypothetical protein KAI45_02200 [Melioribacteraceae bacterium]|nr:hypothetical protein [Melioribacteraceae bacterium]
MSLHRPRAGSPMKLKDKHHAVAALSSIWPVKCWLPRAYRLCENYCHFLVLKKKFKNNFT